MDRQIATVFTNKPLKQCMGTTDNIVPLGCYCMYVRNLSPLSSIGHWPFEATALKGKQLHLRGQKRLRMGKNYHNLCILDYLNSSLTNKYPIISYLGPDLWFEMPDLGFKRPDFGS